MPAAQPAAGHTAARSRHDDRDVLRLIRVIDRDRGTTLPVERQRVIGPQQHRPGVAGIRSPVVVEALLGLDGVAVPHDVVARKPIQRRVSRHGIHRYAVVAGDVLHAGEIVAQHCRVDLVSHLRRDAVEIAQLWWVLADQPVSVALVKRIPPSVYVFGTTGRRRGGVTTGGCGRCGRIRIDTDRVWHDDANLRCGQFERTSCGHKVAVSSNSRATPRCSFVNYRYACVLARARA